MNDNRLLVGDIIEIHGVFRDGTMDETQSDVSENRQFWRVATECGGRLEPVTASGAVDVESYWFGRTSGIAYERGRVGVVSTPSAHA